MKIEPFEMERWQSLHENDVELNLSDSGVHPLSLRELAALPGCGALTEAVLDQRLDYTQTNGTPGLRERIAALYPGATPANVEVTTGGAEANCVAAWTIVEPGDEVVCMLPNYGQLPGLVRGLGAELVPWELRPDWTRGRWTLDVDELERLIGPRTRLLLLCNPSNPTGATFDADWLDAVIEVTERRGVWVLVDEIYQGSEHDGPETPTAWGRGERVIVTNSLSKAYGLPGLRLGWIVGPEAAIDLFWARHDYTTIGPAASSDLAARYALAPAARGALLARGRDLLRTNYARVADWLDAGGDLLRHIPPTAGAMAWLRYEGELDSRAMTERLREEQSVLIVPGAHFGCEGWLRIGFGADTDRVERGLARLQRVLSAAKG